MMRKVVLLLLVVSFWTSSEVLAAEKPFFVTQGNTKAFRPDAAGLLFEQGDVQVWKRLGATADSFKNVYWVNFEGIIKVKEELQEFGKILHFEDNKFAIMDLGDEKKVFNLSATLHEQGMACGVLVALKGDVIAALKTEEPNPIYPVTTKLADVDTSLVEITASNIEATVEKLAAMPTRYYRSETGLTVADKLMEMYQPLAVGRTDVEIGKFEHNSSIPQPSLRIRIVGQENPEEIVVLGSHIDSINSSGGTTARAPGADDNASGTATNLEIFRVLMQKNIKLKRTLEIHGYAAEEIGLRGSQDMAAKYKSENKNVIAMVQHDMNIYCADGPDKIWFVTNNTSPGLNGQLESLLKLYLTVAYGKAQLWAGNSDHYSWTRNGFHAAFPFENPNAYNSHIHTSGDTSANSGRFNQAAEFAKLGLAYVMHFAGSLAASK